MCGAIDSAVGAYTATRKTLTSLILGVSGIIYATIGIMVILRCWPQLNKMHIENWVRYVSEKNGAITSVIVIAIFVSMFLESERQLPRIFSGFWLGVGFGMTLLYWPHALIGLGKWAEVIAFGALVLAGMGLRNVAEALPVGLGAERRARKAVERQAARIRAGDATEEQARAALGGRRSRWFARRPPSADDQEF
jgi:hypothetical protein